MSENNNKSQELNAAISKQEAFVEKNKKPLLIAVAVLILIVAGAILYHNYVSIPRENKASTLLAKCQDLFASGDFEHALNGDNMGAVGFLKVAKQYGSTKAGNLAQLYAGLSYAHLGKADMAVKYLEDYDTAGDAMIEPAAIAALGNCYAKLGKLDKAVDKLKKAAHKADNNTLSPIYLIQAGEISESQGKYDDALKFYNEVKDSYYQSMQYAEIDKYIERVRVKAEK